LAIIPLELRVSVNKSKSFSVSPFLHSWSLKNQFSINLCLFLQWSS